MYNTYNPQINIDKINNQIQELQKMKEQLQQPIPITQNFQLAPQKEVIRYANSIDEVQRDMVIGDTPYFSKDMSVVWVKNTKGDIKTYELTEIIPQDDKDIQIKFLQSQIEELRKEFKDAKSNSTNADAQITSKYTPEQMQQFRKFANNFGYTDDKLKEFGIVSDKE